MIKATTQSGTYYYIDLTYHRAVRVPGDTENTFADDNNWFYFRSISDIEVGKGIMFDRLVSSRYNWRITSDVTKIEEVEISEPRPIL